jgi:hypothetical protein
LDVKQLCFEAIFPKKARVLRYPENSVTSRVCRVRDSQLDRRLGRNARETPYDSQQHDEVHLPLHQHRPVLRPIVAYNVSAQGRHDRVIVDATLHPEPSQMQFLHGKSGTVPVQTAPSGARFVELDLDPHQFVILA